MLVALTIVRYMLCVLTMVVLSTSFIPLSAGVCASTLVSHGAHTIAISDTTTGRRD